MIALPAILMCSTPGCERRCEVLASLRFEYDYVALSPRQVPKGWSHDPSDNETRCPACLQREMGTCATTID